MQRFLHTTFAADEGWSLWEASQTKSLILQELKEWLVVNNRRKKGTKPRIPNAKLKSNLWRLINSLTIRKQSSKTQTLIEEKAPRRQGSEISQKGRWASWKVW